MTSGMERKLNAGKAGKSGKGSGRGRPRKGEGSERKQESEGREGEGREGTSQGDREGNPRRERVTRGSSADTSVSSPSRRDTSTGSLHKDTRSNESTSQPNEKKITSVNTKDSSSEGKQNTSKTDKTRSTTHKKDRGRKEKSKTKDKTKIKSKCSTPATDKNASEDVSNKLPNPSAKEPPDKSDPEKKSSELKVGSENKKESITEPPPSPSPPHQQETDSPKSEDSTPSAKSQVLPEPSEPLPLVKSTSLKDVKPRKEGTKDPKDSSEVAEYPRDAILSRWIESRSAKLGSSSQTPSSRQPRPLMAHKLKPSPFQNLMAAQELLKNQKDSERADKITTETSSDSSDSSGTQPKSGKSKSESEVEVRQPIPSTSKESEEEEPQDLSKPRDPPSSQASDDGSDISDDANKTVGSNDCFADDDDDGEDDDTSNEMRIIEDESELRELDLSMPRTNKPEGPGKIIEQNRKNEIKNIDFSVFKSPKAKDSRSSKASSLDDQNAAACLLQLKSSSTPQSPYVVKILPPEPAHQSSSSSLPGQPMRTPMATRAPPLEAAQPIIPSLGVGENRLITFNPKGVVEGRVRRPLVPPGPEQAVNAKEGERN